MKRFRYILALMAIPFALLLTGCQEEPAELVKTPAINVTSSTLVPNTDESGTVRAYVGTQVTATGFNLDRVGAVKIDGIEAVIAEKTISRLVFEIPELGYAQQDNPYKVFLEVFDADCETVVFRYDYYVTIPVTDALVTGFEPKSGTVGDIVTISGRNIDQITKVVFGGTEIGNASFTEHSAEVIKLAVPAIAAAEAETQVDIAAFWGENEINVTETEKFVLKVPVFNEFIPSSDAYELGSEITLEGTNLDLVSDVRWGEYSLTIKEDGRTSESMTVGIPTGIPQADPVEVTAALKAYYGVPAQEIMISETMKVNTTAKGPEEPVFVSIAPTDGNYDKLYLGREVTVTGENMASVEKFILSGQDGENIEVEVSRASDDFSAAFVMPVSISGTAKKEMTLTAVWYGGNQTDFGTIEVYPFYCTKGLRIGVGSSSSAGYTDDGRNMSFLLLDEGRVISAQEWYATPTDKFALLASNTVTASGKVTGTQEEYYSVQPYIFITASSSNKMAFQNPSASSSQLKTHRYPGNTSVSTTFGTPVLLYRILDDEPEVKEAVTSGMIEDILMCTRATGANAPAFGTAEGDTWIKGSVVMLQYMTYSHASATGGAPEDISDVRRQGYMFIRDVTCADSSTGLAKDPRTGYVEVDLYWSNGIND